MTPDEKVLAAYRDREEKLLTQPPFIVRCRQCNQTVDRPNLQQAKWAVELHRQAEGHDAWIYGLCLAT